ncbi:sensor histidine kinase [Sphingopyxis sp. YF1]|uniref:sensor histidine kinase n=1 Tax=Sphingopyxis sp. YF1 TaxID=2482763 RepID=UPI001F61CE33|nr:sensor histidine kinase [Sphingopyxis sp. YF1]UNU44454.1 sensor histidine kinase [Sphingopyxis sp. YF1]
MTPLSCEAASVPAAAEVLPPIAVPSHSEADHRIANSLQILGALLGLQARDSGSEEIAEALGAASRRVAAISAVHRQLYKSATGRHIELAAYLDELALGLEEGTSPVRPGRAVRVSAVEVHVGAEQAIAVGVLVTELVLNAWKHAYRPGACGDILIDVDRRSDGMLRLEVRDFGRGLARQPSAAAPGMGTRVIEAMARKLGGRYSYRDAQPGTAFTLEADLDVWLRQ